MEYSDEICLCNGDKERIPGIDALICCDAQGDAGHTSCYQLCLVLQTLLYFKLHCSKVDKITYL